ncbi:MAG: cellulase family glycosylhydrolase [Paludibacteraceae bacterium]|nr:cellulase family glycosylhydrolase [Paludibacteraceae bacterium]
MKRLILLPILGLCALSAHATLRQPMNGKFGIDQILANKNPEVRLDSIRTLGEWGGWVDSMAFYKYDEKGRLISGEGFDGNSVKVSSIAVEYDKNGAFTLVETTSYDGKSCNHRYTYKYDKSGQLESLINDCVEGKLISSTQVSYKKKNGQTIETLSSKDGGENATIKYNASGKILSAEYPDKKLEYSYDENGNLISVSEIKNGTNKKISWNKYKYNAKKQIVQSTSFSQDGGKIDSVKAEFTYNEDGQMIRRKSGNSFTDYTYTNNGKVLMETRIDDNNIYGAKNKTYFFAKQPLPEVKKPTYDLSAYPKGSAVAQYGKLGLRGNQLCDEKGNPVQLRGMSTHGVQWFTNIYTDPNAISTLVSKWNINVLRVAMYVQESGYATNAVKSDLEWNAYIDSISNLCAKQGIYCIIDWHILNPGDPLADCNYSKATQFWDYMSKKHGKEAHVLYEICNEPNGGDVSWPRVREYGRHIISTIRKNDVSTVILVGTPVWSQDIDVAALAQLEDQDVMYTLHFYSGSHGAAFRQRGERALAAPYKTPIFITEFGTSDASGDNGFFKEATLDWLIWAKQNKLSWCNWSFADKGESASALQSGAASTGFNALTESGTLIRNILLDPTSVENKANEKK